MSINNNKKSYRTGKQNPTSGNGLVGERYEHAGEWTGTAGGQGKQRTRKAEKNGQERGSQSETPEFPRQMVNLLYQAHVHHRQHTKE